MQLMENRSVQKTLFFIYTIVAFCFAEGAGREVSISGDISGRTFYPETLYRVDSIISVPKGARCYIPAGVVFIFNNKYEDTLDGDFRIEGSLIIDGQESRNVIFTSSCDTTVPGAGQCGVPPSLIDWKGIHFTAGAKNCAVRNLEIRHAGYPVTTEIPCISGRNIRLKDCNRLVAIYNGEELGIPAFLKDELDPTSQDTFRDTVPKLVVPSPQPRKNSVFTWIIGNKVTSGLILSTVVFASVSTGFFIHADNHAVLRDEQRYIADDPDNNYSNEQERGAENDYATEKKATERFAGLGAMSAVFGAASIVGIGITFLF